jgi:hypothetical protein
LWKAFARARFGAPVLVIIAGALELWLNADARAGFSVGDVASWAVLWGASAAALLVVEVVASSALLSVATAVTSGWVPVLVLSAELWNQFASAGIVTEVVIGSSVGQEWEASGPVLAVLEGWLDAFACATIAVPDLVVGSSCTIDRLLNKVGVARSGVWVASASALNGVPMEACSAVLEVIAHARAGLNVPEVVIGTRLFQAFAFLTEFIVNESVFAVKRQLSAFTGALSKGDGYGRGIYKPTAVQVLVFGAE